MINHYGETLENLIAQVRAICDEVSILGLSPSEVVSPELITIGKKLDACFNTFIELNFEEHNPDLLFIRVADLDKIHQDCPRIRVHVVENLASGNSQSDKPNASEHESGHFTLDALEKDGEKRYERPTHLASPPR